MCVRERIAAIVATIVAALAGMVPQPTRVVAPVPDPLPLPRTSAPGNPSPSRPIFDEEFETALSRWTNKITDEWQPKPELQTYTDGSNVSLSDGALVIKAVRTETGWDSARLHSAKSFLYGTFAARIKVPTGAGVWPAFWLLGNDAEYGWPACGEIDIMEIPAAGNGYAYAGTHQPGGSQGSGDLVAPVAIDATGWHTYAVDWRPGRVSFLLDGALRGTVTREAIEARGGVWVFDERPQRIILNLAVGGWGGTPGDWEEQSMQVDWVRVYS